jgi:hypothetical protein
VVLTVSPSERVALRQQQRLQALAPELAGEFDSYVGPDVSGGVSRIARWRHCNVILRQRRAPTAWRWFRGTAKALSLELDPSFAVLELPETALSLVEPTPEADSVSLAVGRRVGVLSSPARQETR